MPSDHEDMVPYLPLHSHVTTVSALLLGLLTGILLQSLIRRETSPHAELLVSPEPYLSAEGTLPPGNGTCPNSLIGLEEAILHHHHVQRSTSPPHPISSHQKW